MVEPVRGFSGALWVAWVLIFWSLSSVAKVGPVADGTHFSVQGGGLFLLVLISQTENRPGLCERERSFAAAVGATMDSISAAPEGQRVKLAHAIPCRTVTRAT